MLQKMDQDGGQADDKDYKPHGIISRQAIKPTGQGQHDRRAKRYNATAKHEAVSL